MKIIETTITTRANTSVNWPSSGIPQDPNDLRISGRDDLFEFSKSKSDDKLIKTTIKVFSDPDDFATYRAYKSNTENTYLYHLNVATIGITWEKKIEVLED